MKKIFLSTLILGSVLSLTGCKSGISIEKQGNRKTGISITNDSTFSKVEDTSNNTSVTETYSNIDAFKISLEDAIKIYQKAYPDTDITDIDIDTSFGSYFYKLEGMDDSTQYEVKIDPISGDLKKEHEEKLDKDEQNGTERQKEKLDFSNILSIQEVASLAETKVGSGKATEWSLNKDNGQMVWEVTIEAANKEIEVKIDALTGNILELD